MTTSDLHIIEEQLCFALASAAASVSRAMCAGLGNADLDLDQYHVLVVLWRRGHMRLDALADRLMVSCQAVQARIDALAAKGLVETLHDNRDSSVTWVMLTDAGRKKQGNAVSVRADVAERLARSGVDIAALPAELMRLAEVLEPERARRARGTRRQGPRTPRLSLSISLGSGEGRRSGT